MVMAAAPVGRSAADQGDVVVAMWRMTSASGLQAPGVLADDVAQHSLPGWRSPEASSPRR
jgi:hypothetical protein